MKFCMEAVWTPKKEDYLKTEDNIKNEDDLKKEEYLKNQNCTLPELTQP